MSDHIPFEIQSEVIKRVHPVKSLIRFRSVCKQWKSLIDSSEFITHHLLVNSNTQPHHLLIRYKEDASDIKCVSVVVDDDNDTFPQHESYPTLPPTVTNNKSMIDSSHGLVCFISIDRELPTKLIVVWNPSIRKSISILSPVGTNIAGFGVCPNTGDIKCVSIKANLTAEVFTLSTRIWRRIPMNLFSTSVTISCSQVAVDGAIHWVACDLNKEVSRKRIIKFDLASEEFGDVALLDGLVGFRPVGISRFKESLAVIDYRVDDAGKIVCDVWVMFKNGVVKSSFTKLFTVKDTISVYSVIGFRKNGQPIVNRHGGSMGKELQVYEPKSEHMNGTGISGSFFDMVNYTESLLLLKEPDSIIQ